MKSRKQHIKNVLRNSHGISVRAVTTIRGNDRARWFDCAVGGTMFNWVPFAILSDDRVVIPMSKVREMRRAQNDDAKRIRKMTRTHRENAKERASGAVHIVSSDPGPREVRVSVKGG